MHGKNSIESAFDHWTTLDDVKSMQSFIDYLNTSGALNALSQNEYDKMHKADRITDSGLMPFGKFAGKHMIDIPGTYLIYIFDRGWVTHAGVKKYIIDNMDALKKEVR